MRDADRKMLEWSGTPMGIYDRDYYRREGPSYLEALIPSGQVCKWLIAINVVVWILQILTDHSQSPHGSSQARPCRFPGASAAQSQGRPRRLRDRHLYS